MGYILGEQVVYLFIVYFPCGLTCVWEALPLQLVLCCRSLALPAHPPAAELEAPSVRVGSGQHLLVPARTD